MASVSTIANAALPDIQAEAPAIELALQEAGITDLRYPITVCLGDGSEHHTVASVSWAASVACDVRGAHMSRFVELLHAWRSRISVETMPALLDETIERLGATAALARFAFPLFLERAAPVTEEAAFVAYDCVLEGQLKLNATSGTLTALVPIKSLCPCSREISDYGAHNQRGNVEISVSFDFDHDERVDFTDLISAAEGAGSARIYSLLKRADERYVTMQAYDNPAFVEDITRAVAECLRGDERVREGRVRVVNEESIHAHNAYAAVAWTR
jgi:GTP cyclohydrolase I